MSSESWPQPLKDWVAKCLGKMTDSNRVEAQAELRQVISDAFTAKTLWTTDWEAVQLKSLQPKPPPNFNNFNSFGSMNNLKRKSDDAPAPAGKKSKKAKKHAAVAAGGPPTTFGNVNDQAALDRRKQRFQREHEIERQKNMFGGKSLGAHNAHLYDDSRSASPFGMRGNPDDPEADPNVPDWDRHTIVGTCQDIFKDYLRLTTEAKPEQIRPYAVLQVTLEELKKRWRAKSPYNWICSQFKSLRQDLTVQRIKNEFTVSVYEIHARIALEFGDQVEYNQCQATLKTLYELGIPGKTDEFTAYHILMLIHGRNRTDLNMYVGQLTPEQKSHEYVRHALSVARAQATGNYHQLFQLFLNAPNMGVYIMELFIDRERIKALIVMSKAYLTLKLPLIQRELAFDDLDSTRDFLLNHQVTFVNMNAPDVEKTIQCKNVVSQLQQVYDQRYKKVIIKGAI